MGAVSELGSLERSYSLELPGFAGGAPGYKYGV